MPYAQYRAFWTVPGGGTGISNFHARDVSDPTLAQAFADTIKQFFIDVRTSLPNDVTISFDSEVTIHNNDGELGTVIPVTAPASTTGGQTGGWAGAAGGRVDWLTGAVIAGRRLRGRTYIVPLAAVAYENDGTLTAATITQFTSAANLVRTGLQSNGTPLVVFSRTHGVVQDVTGVVVNDKTAILRSRRD